MISINRTPQSIKAIDTLIEKGFGVKLERRDNPLSYIATVSTQVGKESVECCSFIDAKSLEELDDAIYNALCFCLESINKFIDEKIKRAAERLSILS